MNFAATGGSKVIWGETGNFSTNVIWGTSATFTSGSSQAEAMSVVINGDK